MLDASISYYRYAFLGCEFLTWLWYSVSNSGITAILKKGDSLEIGNKIVLERKLNDSIEKITIKGKEADLEEGMISLKKGAVVKEINLLYKSGEKEWFFTITGESFSLSNIKTPDIGFIETKNDVEGFAIEKIFLYNLIFSLIDDLYKNFIKLRVSDKWTPVVSDIKKWINS
ncbi:MAG: hypothetical protein KKH97_06085 [Proteobacteria bacterium]|nr:hypothetical protein [Pseudomonadota bacterium]